MIYLELSGGLGNQMFQYAFARNIQEHTKDRILINTYGYRYDNQRTYALGVFQLNDEVFVANKISGFLLYIIARVKLSCLIRLGRSKGKSNFRKLATDGRYITTDIYNYYKPVIKKHRNYYVNGMFQSVKYFDDISNIIKNEFQLKLIISEKIVKVSQDMNNCDAVCIHIRRGDYVTNASDKEKLDICNEKYYKTAIEIIKKKVKEPIFYVFSNSHDDIEWIKENYDFRGSDVKYIDMDNKDYEELYLMSSCRHFIICNSTFSWWAQYLGQYDGKIVVAPALWNKSGQDYKDIYLDNWEIIEDV